MLNKRLIAAGAAGIVGVALFRGRAAVASGAAYWLRGVRARESPSPCPYEQSWLLDFPRPWLTVPRLIDILGPGTGERLLEVGAGTGVYTLPVAGAVEPNGVVDAFDVQQEMLDTLTERAYEQGLSNIRPERGDGRRLPYRNGTFDGAYLITVLGEIPDQEETMRELRRVLKPGGRLVVGELAFSPHFVRPSALSRHAQAAGFRFERRLGPPVGYYVRYSAPS